MLIEVLKAILSEDAAIAALVGDRIYPMQLPDAPTMPALVLSKAAGVGTYSMEGDAGLERARIQADAYDEGYSEMLVLKALVRRRLTGFRGGQTGFPCQIDAAFCINDNDAPVAETERAGPRLRRRTLEFEIWHREL